jgi:hypothetical protein
MIYGPASDIFREGPHAQGIRAKCWAHAKHLPGFGNSQTAGDRRSGSTVGFLRRCVQSRNLITLMSCSNCVTMKGKGLMSHFGYRFSLMFSLNRFLSILYGPVSNRVQPPWRSVGVTGGQRLTVSST